MADAYAGYLENAEPEQTVEFLMAATSVNACVESIRDTVDLWFRRRDRGRFDLSRAD